MINNDSDDDPGQKKSAHRYDDADMSDLTPIRNDRDTGEGGFIRKFRKHDGRPPINEIVREATAGAMVYRVTKAGGLQVVLFQDARDRWSVPKGHIEEGETAQETAIREIGEEVGLVGVEPVCWLGKVHFRYRRDNVLVLMSTQIYLFRAPKEDKIAKEDWMHDARWFDFDEAVDKIEYEDIAKLLLLGRKRLRQRGEIE